MSLRWKLGALPGIFVLSYILGINILQNHVIQPSLERLEREAAVANVRRCVDALTAQGRQMETITWDWAQWNEAYRFVSNENPDFVRNNVFPANFVSIDVDAICFYDKSGALLWGQVRRRGGGDVLPLRDYLPTELRPDGPFNAGGDDARPRSGVWVGTSGAVVVCACPVVHNDGSGPPAGTVLLGRVILPEDIRALAKQTITDLSVEALRPGSPRATSKELDIEGAPQGVAIKQSSHDQLRASTIYPGVRGGGALILSIEMPREIVAQGHRALSYVKASAFLLGLSLLVALMVLFEFGVIRPVRALTQQMSSIAGSGDLSVKLSVSRTDELGVMAREFQAMIGQLAEARSRLLVRTYREAVAEMLQGVVQGIRNSLMTIITTSERSFAVLREVRADRIEGALQQLSLTASDDQQQQMRIIEGGLRRARERVDDAQADLGAVAEEAQHIEEILLEQQRLLDEKPATCPVASVDLVRDAVGMLPEWQRGYLELNLSPELERAPKPIVPRITTARVLANLLLNAVEAAEGVQRGRAEVWISATQVDGEGGPMVEISVCDNGPGIPPEMLSRLFDEGFTTKGDGGRGLGLHWSAGVVHTLGGRLWAVGRGGHGGACLHLALPVGEPES